MDFSNEMVGMDIDVDIMTNLIEPLEHLAIYEIPEQLVPESLVPVQIEPMTIVPVPMEIDIYIPITTPLIRTTSSPF